MASSKTPWSEAEKLQLLFSFIPDKLDWKNFTPLPGRNKKACEHVMTDLRKQMSSDGIVPKAKGASASGSPGPTKKTPTKKRTFGDELAEGVGNAPDEAHDKIGSPKKRKAGQKTKPNQDEDEQAQSPKIKDESSDWNEA